MSRRKRKFSRQFFAQTGEFRVHFLITSQYTHLISRRFLLATDNAMDVSLSLKSISCKIPDNLIKQFYTFVEAFGVGQPIPDAVYMVPSRPQQKSIIVYT